MEHQKTNKGEMQERIYHAKTVEELLAIAAEAGETLTLEEATKLLQEVEAERGRVEGRAKDAFTSAEDLSDEELAKIAGGHQTVEDNTSATCNWTVLANRVGMNVAINFGSWQSRCTFWTCGNDWNRKIATQVMDDGQQHQTLFDGCLQCGKYAICSNCAHRSSQGIFYRDFCTCPEVLASAGL